MSSEEEDRNHLRDYFAGQVLNGIFASGNCYSDCDTNRDKARNAYDLADAMLKERDRRVTK